jgi:hypothetical protein
MFPFVALGLERYKFVVQVVIGEQKGAGFKYANRFDLKLGFLLWMLTGGDFFVFNRSGLVAGVFGIRIRTTTHRTCL